MGAVAAASVAAFAGYTWYIYEKGVGDGKAEIREEIAAARKAAGEERERIDEGIRDLDDDELIDLGTEWLRNGGSGR